ncbi:DNA polymerase I [Fistulifera solaris]|uniref:DNA polymerase I n=1 Tax=Fistulifera solaris TaxID=1519565 RepID=A0A1Z5K2T3_FISSO|nr:DNA polymerase I [Fistulifera solaris]|eukprot:GAX20564.1 DNA polymerase I [Fistulifera solaris]
MIVLLRGSSLYFCFYVMIAAALSTKGAFAFSFTKRRPFRSKATISFLAASPPGGRRRPAFEWDSYGEEVGLSGAYDYEPDVAEMEEMMRQEEEYNRNQRQSQQRAVPKVKTTNEQQSVGRPISSMTSSASSSGTPRSAPSRESSSRVSAPRPSPVIRTISSPQSSTALTNSQSKPANLQSSSTINNLPVYDFFTFRAQNEKENTSVESSQYEEPLTLPEQQQSHSDGSTMSGNTPSVDNQTQLQSSQPPKPIQIPNEPIDLLDFLHDLGAQMTLEDSNNHKSDDYTIDRLARNTATTATSTTESPGVVESPTPAAVTLLPDASTEDASYPPTFSKQTPSAYIPASPSPFSGKRPPPPPSTFLKNDPEKRAVLAQASLGTGTRSPADVLEMELQQITEQIYQQNNNEPFNINSLSQVSLAVFGIPGESTNKEALEAKAASGNRMADLILQYRRLQQKIRKSIVETTSRETASKPASGDPLLLVDASAYIYRAYYSMPPIHRSDGMPTGAVMGFCNMLNRLILNRMVQGVQPRIVLVFDAKGKTFRHELYNEYKAHRAEAPMDLIPQFSLIRQAGLAYGMPMIEAPNYEADDVIATLAGMAQREGLDVHILSGDKDLMQLIRDDGPTVVHMIDPMKMERVTSTQVMEKWNVTPEQLGDVLALAGDVADNVPGVPGIGPKIAADLIREFGSLEYLLDHVEDVQQKARRSKLEQHLEQARLSKALVTLIGDLPVEDMTFPEGQNQVSELRMEPMNENRIIAFYDEMGFRDLKQRFTARLEGVKRTRRPAAANSRWSAGSKVQVPHPDSFRDVPF